MRINQFTPVQRAKFFANLKIAADEVGEKVDVYRKRIMREELGVEHLSEVSRTDGYDRLMCRVLKDAGEFAMALDYIGGDIKRLSFLAIEAAKKCSADADPHSYIASVMTRMHLSNLAHDELADRLRRHDGWDDFTPQKLKLVLVALNLHVRRRR